MKNIKKVVCGEFMMYRRRGKWQITKKGCTIPRDAKTAKEALNILRTLYALSLIDNEYSKMERERPLKAEKMEGMKMTNTKKSYTVDSMKKAWMIADQIIPTDYIKNEEYSRNAGYPIYTSTAAGVNAWISDLGTGLEVNLPNGQTVRIHVEEPDAWDYNGAY